MSSIGNVSSLIASSYSGIGSARHQRPDPAEMAEDLFSRLDTTGKGYIEQSDQMCIRDRLRCTSILRS